MEQAIAEHSEAIRVMLVNEHPLCLWALEKLIESQRPRMDVSGKAHTHEDALRLLDVHPADVVLMDLDGGYAVESIARLLAGSRTKVLALSSSMLPDLLDSAVLSGASGVVSKGEEVDVLLKAIERVHLGELWVDRTATGRIVRELSTRGVIAVSDAEKNRVAQLTRKELQTVSEIGRDASASSREIAARLDISEHTLRNHLSSIYAKLGLRNRVDLFAYANRHGLAARPEK